MMMVRWFAIAAVAVTVVVGCQRKNGQGRADDAAVAATDATAKTVAAVKPKPKPPSKKLATPSCGAGGDCKRCVTEFTAWMEALASEGHANVLADVEPFTLAQLPASADATRLPRAPLLYVNAKGVEYRGKSIVKWTDAQPKVANITTTLREAIKPQCRRKSAKTPVEVIVAVAAGTAWREIVRVVGAVDAAGADGIQFAFLKASALETPAPSRLDTALAARAARVSGKGSIYDLFAGPMRDSTSLVYGSCKPAMDEWKQAGKVVGYSDEAATLAVVMPRSLEACECKFDALEAKVLHYWAGGRRRHPGMYATGIQLMLAGEKPRRAVAATAELSWRIAYPRVVTASKSEHPHTLTLAGAPPPKAGVKVPLRRACSAR